MQGQRVVDMILMLLQLRQSAAEILEARTIFFQGDYLGSRRRLGLWRGAPQLRARAEEGYPADQSQGFHARRGLPPGWGMAELA